MSQQLLNQSQRILNTSQQICQQDDKIKTKYGHLQINKLDLTSLNNTTDDN